jgi:glycosyltransferase involved in cell wall biosynthesis
MKKIKVLLFTDTFCDVNGVSRFIQDISLLAQKEGLSFFVVTSSVKECPKFEGVEIFEPKFRMKIPFYPDLDLTFPSYRALERYTDQINPDVVHISTPGFVGLMGRRIAKNRSIPMVGTYHTDFPGFAYKNIPFEIVRKIGNLLMQVFYKEFCALFVRSEAYKQIVHHDVKFDLSQIHALQAGIDTRKFNTSFKEVKIWERYGVPKEATKALYVGRLTKEKNFPMLLELWKAYYEKSRDKNVYLIVLGGTFEDERLFEAYHIKALGIKKGEELSRLYASSDLFLFPSTTDTLGQVVMEAMSSGLPVIVSDQGGPKTLIDEKNRQGYAINVNQKQQWIDTIEKLMNDSRLRQEFGENGANHIAGMTIEKSFETFWQVHCSVTKM